MKWTLLAITSIAFSASTLAFGGMDENLCRDDETFVPPVLNISMGGENDLNEQFTLCKKTEGSSPQLATRIVQINSERRLSFSYIAQVSDTLIFAEEKHLRPGE